MEAACYTLINNPSETETPNEQQLKHDLGEPARGVHYSINQTTRARV